MLEDLKETGAVVQIATPSGEEVLCTTSNPEEDASLTQLTNAFVEANTLAHSLKLGSVRRVITETKDGKFTVQSKVQGKEDELLSTVVADSLQASLVSEGLVAKTTSKLLN